VDGDWPFLAELFLGLVDLANEIDEALAGLGHALLWPLGELELAHSARLSVPGVGDLKEEEKVSSP